MSAMRGMWMILLAALLLASPARAAEDGAGVARLTVAGQGGFDLLVFYPASGPVTPWQAGPFTLPATHGAPVRQGRFPLLLLSHGGGRGGGSPMILAGLAADLARHGYIVAAPFHGHAGLAVRARQLVLARDAALADPRFAAHADPARLGLVGFSLGGAVVLAAAGALPDDAHLQAYCTANPSDAMACDHAPDAGHAPAPLPALPALQPGAIILLDPLGAVFARAGLAAVTAPVLVIHPAQSALPAEGNAGAMAAQLPHAQPLAILPGSHFVFADRCPDTLHEADICDDPPGVDRGAVQQQVQALVADFLAAHP